MHHAGGTTVGFSGATVGFGWRVDNVKLPQCLHKPFHFLFSYARGFRNEEEKHSEIWTLSVGFHIAQHKLFSKAP